MDYAFTIDPVNNIHNISKGGPSKMSPCNLKEAEERAKQMYKLDDETLAKYYKFRENESKRDGVWEEGAINIIRPPCTCPSKRCQQITRLKLKLIKK